MDSNMDIQNVCKAIFLNNSSNDNRPINFSNNNEIKIIKQEEQTNILQNIEKKESVKKLIMNPKINTFKNIIREDINN